MYSSLQIFSTFRFCSIKCRQLIFIPNFCCKYQSKKYFRFTPVFVDAVQKIKNHIKLAVTSN